MSYEYMRFITTCFFLLTLLSISFSSYSLTTDNEILIPLNKWASQRVISIAIGQLIEEMNLPVEYLDISVGDQWGALQRGAVHFQIETWQPSTAKSFNKLVSNNAIVDMGTHKAVVIEDWWYPKYVEKYCPELPSWQALNKCKFLFANQSSPNKGVYYAGPWDYDDGDIIRALHLDFVIERLPDEHALWEKLNSAVAKKLPILLLNWSPNWTDKQIDGRFIQFPAYTPECELDPSWGLNKNLVKDCGNPRHGWLKKAAWPGLKEKSPCVYQLIKNISLTNIMISDASGLVVIDGYSESDAAAIWTKKYRNQLKQWQVNACIPMLPQGAGFSWN